jgi:hypothetical protein
VGGGGVDDDEITERIGGEGSRSDGIEHAEGASLTGALPAQGSPIEAELDVAERDPIAPARCDDAASAAADEALRGGIEVQRDGAGAIDHHEAAPGPGGDGIGQEPRLDRRAVKGRERLDAAPAKGRRVVVGDETHARERGRDVNLGITASPEPAAASCSATVLAAARAWRVTFSPRLKSIVSSFMRSAGMAAGRQRGSRSSQSKG